MIPGGAAASAVKAFEQARLEEEEKAKRESERVSRASPRVARRFGKKADAPADAPEPTTKFREGEYVVIGDREIGQLVKVLPDGKVKTLMPDGTAKWRHEDDLRSVFGSSDAAPKAMSDLAVGDWIHLKGKPGDPVRSLPVGQLTKREGNRVQVRTSDGKTKWKDLSDLEPPSADAPHTGVVIGPDGELLEPHWAADQAALKEEQAAAQEEAASHLAAHMGAMARLRRAMSSTDEIEGETSDEDDSDDGAPPRNRIPVPMAGRAPQSVAASGVVPSGISNSGGGGGGAGRVRWEKVVEEQPSELDEEAEIAGVLQIASVGAEVRLDTEAVARPSSLVRESNAEAKHTRQFVASAQARQSVVPPSREPRRATVSTGWFGGGKSKKAGAAADAAGGGGVRIIPSKYKFGIPLESCALVHSYGCQVPKALSELWKAMLASPRGIETEGIFRLTPDPDECADVERELTSGNGTLAPERAYNPIVLGHLMKSFLRRLPPPGVLGAVPIAALVECETAEGCAAMLDLLEPLERGVLEWLVRVILEVHGKREANKMKLKNLTVVFAPNLWLIPLDGLAPNKDPREELRNVEKVENALHMLCTFALRISKPPHKSGAGAAAALEHRNSFHAVAGDI